jgi:malate synthase
VDYFVRRLKVGAIHDKINLPFWWYIGSYVECQRLTSMHLREAFQDAQEIASAEQARKPRWGAKVGTAQQRGRNAKEHEK